MRRNYGNGDVLLDGVMYRLTRAHSANYLVHIEPNTYGNDYGQKKLPYSTIIGTVDPVAGKINVWTPAAPVFRGYVTKTRRVLAELLAMAWKDEGRPY